MLVISPIYPWKKQSKKPERWKIHINLGQPFTDKWGKSMMTDQVQVGLWING